MFAEFDNVTFCELKLKAANNGKVLKWKFLFDSACELFNIFIDTNFHIMLSKKKLWTPTIKRDGYKFFYEDIKCKLFF